MPFYTQRQQIARLIGTLEDIGKDEEVAEEFIKHDRKAAINLLSQVLKNGVDSDAIQRTAS